MANPRNSVTLMGRIGKGGVRYLATEDNSNPFGCLFTVLVSRGYRSKKTGKYEMDPISVKFVFRNDSVRQFSRRLEAGDGVIISGTLRIENEKTIVYTEDISCDDLTLDKKYQSNERKSVYSVPQKPLPY